MRRVSKKGKGRDEVGETKDWVTENFKSSCKDFGFSLSDRSFIGWL